LAIRDSSPSSTDGAPEVPGFEVGPLLARDELGPVHEATQHGLDRRVALRLLQDDPALGARLRRLRWPDHERAADLYAAGARPDGFFVARQLVEGPKLTDLPSRRAQVVLRDAAAALEAAHAQGIVHGAIGPHTVLVDGDGRGVLADFCLGADGASADDDRAALAALGAAHTTGRRRARAATIAVTLAACGGGVVALALPGDAPEAPPALPGAQVLGSPLDPAEQGETLDCEGRAPGGASPACTLVQSRLPGRPLNARRGGVVRRWRAPGARGELALVVLRARARAYEVLTRGEPARVGDGRAVAAALPVEPGDLVGVELTPGSGVGVRRDTRGASIARWIGPLTIDPRAPDDPIAGELLLRVEVEPGARAAVPGLLEGRAAAAAPAGREIDRRQVDLPDGERRAAAVVLTAGRVVVDLFDRGRRVARVPVAGADPRGRLTALDTLGRPLLFVRWRNPDGTAVQREYGILSDGLRVRR
jgi:hypothetical protein